MDVRQAINERHSIRGYLDKPVAKETLQEVLKLATRAVSAVNCQPWEFAVISGEVIKQIAEDNSASFRENRAVEQEEMAALSGIYADRRKDVGKRLFAAMGIGREDKEARIAWSERGFRFFDAPCVILVLMDEALDESCYRFDVGCVVQNLCIAAMEYGLGTCVEYQAVAYHRGLKKYLDLPQDRRLVCGIAIGYPDPEYKANAVVTPREDVDKITQWYGF